MNSLLEVEATVVQGTKDMVGESPFCCLLGKCPKGLPFRYLFGGRFLTVF